MSSQSEILTYALLGVFLGVTLMHAYKLGLMLFYKFKAELHYMRNPRLVAYSETRACIEPHKWTTLTLALRDFPPGQYQACLTCGAIVGNQDVMLSDFVLGQAREGLELAAKKLELENAVADRIEEITMNLVDRAIATEFADEFKSIHYVAKLRKLVQHGFKAKEEAVKKVEAELRAQTELNARYQDWPKRRRGNA